jgi:hypothetical protein
MRLTEGPACIGVIAKITMKNWLCGRRGNTHGIAFTKRKLGATMNIIIVYVLSITSVNFSGLLVADPFLVQLAHIIWSVFRDAIWIVNAALGIALMFAPRWVIGIIMRNQEKKRIQLCFLLGFAVAWNMGLTILTTYMLNWAWQFTPK